MRLFFVIIFLTSSLSCSQSDDPKLFFDKGQYEKAYALWQPLANNGDLVAQNYIGIHYYLGLGIKRNLGLANKWFQFS